MMQECSMRDKIKPGVYAILSAVALCISGRFSVIIGGWAKLAAELSGEKRAGICHRYFTNDFI